MTSSRVAAVDIIRGAVMILMSVDHVRVYSGLPAGGAEPEVFVTRWSTRFCAPAFVFLAGTSAYLCGRRYVDLTRVLRGLNLYGDPRPWGAGGGASAMPSLLASLNTVRCHEPFLFDVVRQHSSTASQPPGKTRGATAAREVIPLPPFRPGSGATVPRDRVPIRKTVSRARTAPPPLIGGLIMSRIQSALSVLAVLACVSSVCDGAPFAVAGFSGAWRCVGGEFESAEMKQMTLTIEEREGRCFAVGVSASDANLAPYAEESSRYIAGELTRQDARTLRMRRAQMEPIEGGQLKVIVDNTFTLQPGGDRLRLKTVIFPANHEEGKLATYWDFQRVPKQAGSGPVSGRGSRFEVWRPTFHDAVKVGARGREVRSPRVLETGARYRVRVEGSVSLAKAVRGKWVVADAAYIFHAERSSSYFGRTPSREGVLLINDRALEPAQGFITEHIYTMDLDGTGEPLGARVADPLPEDNEGSLDIRIYRLRRDLLLADRPSSLDPALAPVDLQLGQGRLAEALPRLSDAAGRTPDRRVRERLYQLVGVLEFVLSRPLDPELLQRDVVMPGTHPFGRAVDFDRGWAGAVNNLGIWEAWNGNISEREGNARARLEEALQLLPDDPAIQANLRGVRAEAGERR